MARIDVELAPQVADVIRDAQGGRFTRGAVRSAVRWAAGLITQAADGDDSALASAARPSDLPGLRDALARLGVGPLSHARFVELAIDADPPVLVAELSPGGARVVLCAVDFPNPAWKVTALIGPGTEIPSALAERVLVVPGPVAELDWVVTTLLRVASALDPDLAPPANRPRSTRTFEDLGMGEHRSIESLDWDIGAVHLAAGVADHVINDGTTPAWAVLRGTVDGLAGGASMSLVATLRVQDEPTATLVVTADADRLGLIRSM